MWITIRNLLMMLSIIITSEAFAQDNNKINLANEYLSNGELEKAKDLYKDLAKSQRNITFIHKHYFDLLLDLNEFKTAEGYLKKIIKSNPQNLTYKIDNGILAKRKGKPDDVKKIFSKLIDQVKSNEHKSRAAARYFLSKDLSNEAKEVLLASRKANNLPHKFALDLAQIYRRTNERNKMIEEYLNFADENPANINYIKSVLQSVLTEEQDLKDLESLLYDKVQQKPDKVYYTDLLVWINIQQKDFFGAFVQARAFDKRFKTDGRYILDVGYIAFDNEDYRNAKKIFQYIVNEYPDKKNSNYVSARQYLVRSKEQIVKNTFPINQDEIRSLIEDYQHIIDESGLNKNTRQSMHDQALLYAFYLNEKDSAIQLLSKVINDLRSGTTLIAISKLDLGDIYLLNEEPWESTLLYSQVEKSNKESTIGHDAKLRNAKLSFYKGDFELAEAHLDVLKLATTREIANDAMALSLLIKDNTVLDTTEFAMQAYANVELLLFQNKDDEALVALDTMLSKFKGHSLTDEIFWMKAKIYQKRGDFERSIAELTRITTDFSYDILSDDADFLIATIYQDQLNETSKSKEMYKSFMTKYPGSKYTAEARKRFRDLRGDFVNQ